VVPAADDVREVRVREVQIHGAPVEAADGGRTALLLAGVETGILRRGQVLTADPGITASSRLLVALQAPAGLANRSGPRGLAGPAVPADRERLRLHMGTDQAAALVVRGPREAIELPDGSTLAILRLDAPVAARPGDRFALRRPSPGSAAGGGVVLDAQPPRGISRRRMSAARAAALAGSPQGTSDARLDLHGALALGSSWSLAPDVEASLRAAAVALVTANHQAEPESPGLPLPTLRATLALAARRGVTLGRAPADEVARTLTDTLIADGLLARDGDRIRDPRRAAGPPPEVLAAMDRLEAALSVAAPPALSEAARVAGCPADGVRALEAAGRIVRLEDNLAWSGATYRKISKQALAMASAAPLSPAAFRDATGTSRKFVMAILEDLDRRGLLRRTDAGHVLGPKMLQRLAERATAKPTGESS
jgi:selenocysteine-specific elongation factor